MPISIQQLRRFTIETLQKVPKFYSKDAVKLMMLVTAAESDGGHWLYQIHGPALSFWGVEPTTCRDNYDSYLKYRPDLSKEIGDACGVYEYNEDALCYNLAYALLHARLKFWRSSRPMPSTIKEMAEWYKEWYNTSRGKANAEVVIAKYHRFVKK